MKLLTFAHKGEAQAFFHPFSLEPVPFVFPGLFTNSKNIFLLLTGEGIHNASQKTTAVLSRYHTEINEVINYGICGSLRKELLTGTFCHIRTAYGHEGANPFFHSFPLTNSESSLIDCISTNIRIQEEQEVNKIIPFASCVDRELWGIASACKMFGKPLSAFKQVSDQAGNGINCLDIKNQSLNYSNTFFEHFSKNENQSLKPNEKILDLPYTEILSHPSFHFTFTQKKIITKLLKNIELNSKKRSNDILKSLGIDQIISKDLTPKLRTKELLQRLEDSHQTFDKKVSQKILKELSPLNQQNTSTQINLSDGTFELKIKLNNEKEFKDLQKNILSIDSPKLFKAINGLMNED